MVQLPASEFTYGKYGMINFSWEDIKSTASYVKCLLSQNIIGYCDSSLCEIRPRPEEMAVMFEEEDGFQSWTHVPKDVWESFILEEVK